MQLLGIIDHSDIITDLGHSHRHTHTITVTFQKVFRLTPGNHI